MPLVRTAKSAVDLAALEHFSSKLAREIQALLESRIKVDIALVPATANAARYPEWRIAQNPFGAIIRFRWSGGNEEMLLHLPGFLVSQLVDLHYGGTGNVPVSGEFSAAELRFVERLADQLASIFQTIFAPFGLSSNVSAEVQTDILFANWPKSRDEIAVQPITVEGAGIKASTVSVVIAIETIRSLSGRTDENAANDVPSDAAWAERVRQAAMNVRLPARTVLTRSELPFQRLLTLSPGDILPLLLPVHIPLTVAGRTFAHGTLGEANGRAALFIEKLEKEPQ
jgi:flagellar motor switch protein FliM